MTCLHKLYLPLDQALNNAITFNDGSFLSTLVFTPKAILLVIEYRFGDLVVEWVSQYPFGYKNTMWFKAKLTVSTLSLLICNVLVHSNV